MPQEQRQATRAQLEGGAEASRLRHRQSSRIGLLIRPERAFIFLSGQGDHCPLVKRHQCRVRLDVGAV